MISTYLATLLVLVSRGVEGSCGGDAHVLHYHSNVSFDSVKSPFLLEKVKPTAWNLFSTGRIKVISEDARFRLSGASGENGCIQNESLWRIPFRPRSSKATTRKLSPFENFHFSILFDDKTNHSLTIVTSVIVYDMVSVAMFVGGSGLFFLAPSLSRSVMFHYSSGVSIGMLLAWLMILVLLLKLMPYKRFFTATFVASGSAGLYFTEYLYQKGVVLIKEYPRYFAGYCIFMMLLTTALIYYFGPVTSEKAFNLIQWTLQLISIYFIYQSSYYKQFSVTAIVITVILHLISRCVNFLHLFSSMVWALIPRKIYYRFLFKRPQHKFLTMEEYDEQGRIATAKALTDLRRFCSSPDCKSWSVVSRLQHPKQFASFVEDGKHFSSDELSAYDQFEVMEGEEDWFSDDEVEANNVSQDSERLDNSILSSSHWTNDES